jgi:fibronectin type 3 domain-containing protein
MMTRYFKTAVFRNHVRWIVMASTMMLVIAAILMPRAVVSQSEIPVPTNLMVTGVSNGNIELSWSSTRGVNLIERSESMSGPFEVLQAVSGTSFNDVGVSSLKTYVYRVRAVGATGGFSAPSNMAVGTAISFANSKWVNNPITAQSFEDVRTAINAMRYAANLPLLHGLATPCKV